LIGIFVVVTRERLKRTDAYESSKELEETCAAIIVPLARPEFASFLEYGII
jgi:hypothetical protein